MPKPMVERDEKDQHWRPLFEHLKDKPYGYVCVYHEIQAVMGSDPIKGRFDVYRAKKELQRLSSRTLIVVRGQGYRIAEPKEHADLIEDQLRYARNRTKEGVRIGAAADRTALTPQESVRLSETIARVGRMNQVLKRHGKEIQEVKDEQAALKADMDARLSRIEQALNLQQH